MPAENEKLTGQRREARVHRGGGADTTTPGRAFGEEDRADGAVGGWRLLLAIVAWIALSVAAGMATWASLNALAPAWSSSTDGPVLVIVAEVYLALLVALLLAFGGPAGVRDHLRFRYTSARDLLLALAIWALCWVAIALIYVALAPVLGPPQNAGLQLLRFGSDMSRLADAGLFSLALIVVRACLLAPLAEELLFRGALFGWVRKRLSAMPTILVTAALFAAIHMEVLLLPVTLLWGIAAGWVRERTGSTVPFFAAHVVNSVVMLAIASLLVALGMAG
jgi:membrane protease YdiL (CAAX protease family)